MFNLSKPGDYPNLFYVSHILQIIKILLLDAISIITYDLFVFLKKTESDDPHGIDA